MGLTGLRVWSILSRLANKASSFLGSATPLSGGPIIRMVSLTVLLAYGAAAIGAYATILTPSPSGMRVGLCDGSPCVSWVMPAGEAWQDGAATGMGVESINGRPTSEYSPEELPFEVISQARLLSETGEAVEVVVEQEPFGESYTSLSLWVLGGLFAILGSTVLLRRPDLGSARWFASFAAASSVALAVGPSAGAQQAYWTLAVQVLSLLGIGATCFPFVVALTNGTDVLGRVFIPRGFVFVATAIATAYTVSVVAEPDFYAFVRPLMLLYVATSIITAVVMLSVVARRQESVTSRQQSRIALWGIALGTFPVIFLTLIPQALTGNSLAPDHVTILAVGLVPASFAYAILQHQLLGIRRLVHRGMVYGVASVTVFALITIALSVALSPTGGDLSPAAIAAVLVGGVLLFFPVRRAARWMVDNYFYGEVVDYYTFMGTVEQDLVNPGSIKEAVAEITERFARTLRLESALMFLGKSPDKVERVASAGDRAQEVVQDFLPRLSHRIEEAIREDLAELNLESESFLASTFRVSERYLGYMLLGPKANGEVFVEEEKRLVGSIAPVLALAIDTSQLSDDLRDLNRRLTKAQEEERARIAGDLHDGPLQKAMLLGSGRIADEAERERTSNEMILELREISSRLRPAILDDLGLVPALEWLADGVVKRSDIQVELSLRNVDEEDRFDPDVELALFRVTQEATNNAVKYARGTRADVVLSRNNGTLELRVEDDGVGFPTSNGKNGTGIAGMRERVIQLSGTLEVVSSPAKGTTVVARIPVG